MTTTLTDTLDLLLHMNADSVERLRVDLMTKDELRVHLVNAAVIVRRTMCPSTSDAADEAVLLAGVNLPVVREP